MQDWSHVVIHSIEGAYVVFSMQRICEKHVHFVVEIRLTQTLNKHETPGTISSAPLTLDTTHRHEGET